MLFTKYFRVALFVIPATFLAVGTISLAKEDDEDRSWRDTEQAHFIRGDVDGDGLFNGIVDAFYLLDYGFQLGPEPTCLEAADVDDNGTLNALSDSLYLLSAAFRVGPPPAAPFPTCGVDPDPAHSLGCDIDQDCN